MCELLGMSTDAPTDICFSFTELMKRGGESGPHADGWGIAFYEDKGVRTFLDPSPSHCSRIADLVRDYPIRSCNVIGHIRQANAGMVALQNTHPFVRELWGRYWVFAHNGQFKSVKKWPLGRFNPVGTTDSEHAFCWLMSQIDNTFQGPPSSVVAFHKQLKEWCDQLREQGVCNLIFSDSRYTYAYCTTKLTWFTRRPPFSVAKLKDADVTVDFKLKDTQVTAGTIIATAPLTDNEDWQVMQPGEFLVFRKGEIVRRLL
ncbi:class II glutamine amidotransferase [Porticoccaceae bacterium LTM1]|nr:class II glutamine amidotransferase [Porticoccaceae bacterium LTM1]